MSKLKIESELVEEILLVDGWHKIVRGSLVVAVGYEFDSVGSEKWAFRALEANPGALTIVGPVTSILAYKVGSR